MEQTGFKNLEIALQSYAESVGTQYKDVLNAKNYRIAESVKWEVKTMGSVYIVVLNLEEYWKWIENGRKPGKMPPPDSLISWIKSKGIQPKKGIAVKSLAFLIARKIGRVGIKPKHLLTDVLNRQGSFKKKITDAFKADIKDAAKSITLKD